MKEDKNKIKINPTDTVNLTFRTTKGTSELLKKFAHINGITQPELIDIICRQYIENKAEEITIKLIEHGIPLEEIIENGQ